MAANKESRVRFQRPRIKFLALLALLILLVTAVLSPTSAQPVDPASLGANDAATVELDGPVEAVPGQLLSYNIISDAAGLFGASADLSFDPTVLQVVGTQLTPGSCPKPDFVVLNNVDNGTGTLSYAATSLAPTPPCDGGVIASFQFQVSSSATASSTEVAFDKVILADSNGTQIPADPVNLQLDILAITAEFSATPTTGPAPLTVNFTNLSSGPYNGCTWSFGDTSGEISCANQTHVYTNPGLYTVSLNISGPGGSDTETKTNYIHVYEEQKLYLPVIMAD